MFVKVPGIPIDVRSNVPVVPEPPLVVALMASDPSTSVPPKTVTTGPTAYIGITDETRVDL